MKIGYLPLYIKLYDDIDIDRSVMEAFYKDTTAMFKDRGFDVETVDFCRIKPEFDAAVASFEKAGVDVNIKVKDWTDAQAAKVREVIGADYKVEGDLRSEIQLNIKRLMDIGCYRGIRHRIGLPVRGQSTKNNARTRKGRKKTVANKKKATK